MRGLKFIWPGLLLLAGCLPSSNVGVIPEKVTRQNLTAPPYVHQRLDNGLEVLLIRNPLSPMVGYNVQIKVGSAYETFATSGMSHMLEHMLFNGTTSRTQQELYDDQDRIGGYFNANTGEYYTNFMAVVPRENAKEAAEILADMLFNSTLPPEKFSKEQGIVLEEIAKTLANPQAVVERDLQSLMYPQHGLSLPTLGTYATIANMQRDEVWEFYRGHYLPNNMVLSVIGAFDPDSMAAWLKVTFGKATPAEVKHPVADDWRLGLEPAAPIQTGTIHNRSYPGRQPRLDCLFPLPENYDPAFLDLLSEALEQWAPDLRTELRKEFPEVVANVRLQVNSAPIGSFLQVRIDLKHDTLPGDLVPSIKQKIYKFRPDFSAAEVTALANKARSEFFRQVEKPHMFGIYNATDLAVEGIDAVMAAFQPEAYRVAARKLSRLKLNAEPLVVWHHPRSQAAKVDTAGAGPVSVYTKGTNGATLIFRRNPSSQLIAVHFLVKHKAWFEDQYGEGLGYILHQCLKKRLTSPEANEAAAQFGLHYKFNDNPYLPMDDIYLNPDFSYIRVEALKDDPGGLLQFLLPQIVGFIPTQEEFQQAHYEYRQVFRQEHSRNSSKRLFRSLIDSVLFREPQRAPHPKTNWQKVKAASSAYFHPSNLIISVVSPWPADSLYKLFVKHLSYTSWPLKKHPPTKPYQRQLFAPESPVYLEQKGGGEQSHLFYGYVKKIRPADRPVLRALSLILRDRVVFSIREKQGLTYHMGVGISFYKNQALVYLNVDTRPENVAVLKPQLKSFLSSEMVADFTPEELRKDIEKRLGRLMFRRLSSINQAYYLGYDTYFNGDPQQGEKELAALRQVTYSQVRKAAQEFLRSTRPITIIVR